MVGEFQKESGHEMFYFIMAIIETLKKQNKRMNENIRKLFMSTLVIF